MKFRHPLSHSVHPSATADGADVRHAFGRGSQEAAVGVVGGEILEATTRRHRRGIQEMAQVLPPRQGRASFRRGCLTRRRRGQRAKLERPRWVIFCRNMCITLL